MIAYRIPVTDIKFSTNKIYAGVHWTTRKTIKDSVLSYATGFCRPVVPVQSYPVEICYRFSFSSRPLDSTNCTALVKMFEDALRSLGVIKDDSPQYVARTIIEVVVVPNRKNSKTRNDLGKKEHTKDEDWLEIKITPVVISL